MFRAIVAVVLLAWLPVIAPVSAVSADAPKYSQSDRWVYDITGAYNVKGKMTMQVIGIVNTKYMGSNISAYLMNVNRTGGSMPGNVTTLLTMALGKINEEYSGTSISYSPPYALFRFPLQTGDSYEYQCNRTVHQSNSTVTDGVNLKVSVDVYEEVIVAAGRFDAFKIDAKETGTSSEFKVWYSPRAGNVVKQEYWLGGSLQQTWSLSSFSYSNSPPETNDYALIAVLAACVVVPLVVLLVFRKRVARVIRARGKKGPAKKRPAAKKVKQRSGGIPGKSRERLKSTKAYNRKPDKE